MRIPAQDWRWRRLCRFAQDVLEFDYKDYSTTQNSQTKQNPTKHTQSNEQNQGKVLSTIM